MRDINETTAGTDEALRLVRRIRACEGAAAGVALLATYLRGSRARVWLRDHPEVCRCPRRAYGYPMPCQCGYDDAIA